MSSTAPYSVKKSEAGDFYIVLSSANLTFQRGLTEQEAHRITDLMNDRAKESLAKAEFIRAAAVKL